MDASMWVAKTGLSAQSTRMTVIANNLANVNTTGFKKDRAMFEREKLAAEYFQKINNLFGPAIYKLSTSNIFSELR